MAALVLAPATIRSTHAVAMVARELMVSVLPESIMAALARNSICP
jgi:hypothetical protein